MTSLFQGFSFRAAAPQLLFLSSISLTTIALHWPPRAQRRYFLVPILVLNTLALLSIDEEATEWGPLGSLDSVIGLVCCVFGMVAPLVLWDEERSIFIELSSGPEGGETVAREKLRLHGDVVIPSKLSISTSIRIWNNSRVLKFQNRMPGHEPWNAILRFGLSRTIKAGLILGSDFLVVRPLVAYIDSANYIEHFAADQRPLLRRVFIHQDPTIFDTHVLTVRALTAVYWIWDNFCVLETCHAALAIIAVCVLHMDDPSDWPALFGAPWHAYTIRRFWGRFWHRSVTPPAGAWSSKAAQCLGLTKGSRAEKAAVAFGIFFLSGVSHSLVAWRKGGMAPWSDVLFFIANFGVVALEMVVSNVFRRVLKMTGHSGLAQNKGLRVLGRFLGYLWVFSWFFWVTPRWLYPKYYAMSLRADDGYYYY